MTDQLHARAFAPETNTGGAAGGRAFGGLGAPVSRRTVLTGLSAAAVGALSGCGPLARQDIGGGAGGAAPPGPGTLPGAGAPRSAAASLTPKLTTPYVLTADAVLSEDHFNLAVHPVGPDDTVIAYARRGRPVEAILLQNGTISQLYRDPDATGGWAIKAVVEENVTDVVAGVQSDDVLHLWYRIGQQADHCFHLAESDPLTWKNPADDLGSWAGAGPLKLTVGTATNLVTAIKPGDSNSAELFWYVSYNDSNPSFGTATNFTFLDSLGRNQPVDYAATLQYAQGLVTVGLFVPSIVIGQSSPISSKTWVVAYEFSPQQGSKGQNYRFDDTYGTLSPASADKPWGTAGILWAEVANVPAGKQVLRMLVRTPQRSLIMLICPDIAPTPTSTFTQVPLTVPDWQPGHAGAPVQLDVSLSEMKGDITDLFLLATPVLLIDNTVHIVRQLDQDDPFKNDHTPIYYPSLPILGGVVSLAAQPRVTKGDELLVVVENGGRTGLAELVRDGTTGVWRSHPITLPNSEVLQTSTYRVGLKLIDDYGYPAGNQPLTITATTVAPALVNGQAVILGPSATTLSTGVDGTLTIAMLADGLGTADLTIANPGLAQSLVVHPNHKLNDYLAGGANLGSMPPLTTATLKQAPGCAGLKNPGAALTNLNSAAHLGANPPAKLGASRHRPHHHHHHRPVVLGTPRSHLRGSVEVGGIWTSLADLGDDVLQGIKAGVNTVDSVAVDLDTGKVSLTGLFGEFASDAFEFVIDGLEAAAHAFHAIIAFVGAAVSDFVHYLEAKILVVLKDTLAVAQVFDGWLKAIGPTLAADLTKLTASLDGDLDGLKKQFSTEINTLITTKVSAGQTLSDVAPKAGLQASRRRGIGATAPPSGNAVAAPGDSHQQWLIDKIRQLVPTVTSHQQLSWNQGTFDGLWATIQTDAKDTLTAALVAIEDLWTAVDTLVSKPKEFLTAGVAALLGAVEKTVEALLDFFKAIIDTLSGILTLGLEAMSGLLDLSLDDIPLVGPLLESLGVGEVTIGLLACTLLAFPTVVAYKVAKLDSTAVPPLPAFQGAKASASRHRVGDNAPAGQDALTDVGMGTLVVWGILDAVAAGLVLTGEVPEFFGWVDLVAPIIVACCSWPSENMLPGEPLDDSSASKQLGLTSWFFGLAPAIAGYLVSVIAYKGESDLLMNILPRLQLYFTSGVGTLSALTGLVAAMLPGGDLVDGVFGTITNIPNIGAIALSQAVVESSEGTSAFAMTCLDILCCLLGAGSFAHTRGNSWA